MCVCVCVCKCVNVCVRARVCVCVCEFVCIGADSERCINAPSRASQTPYSLALDRQDVSVLTILATHAAYLLRAGNVYMLYIL